MDQGARRAVAYIAGLAVSGRSSGAVYDYTGSGYFHFSGSVDASQAEVYDYDRSCHISGNLNSLYDYGRSAHIELQLNGGGRFSGYDYGTSSHFSGQVSGQSISLFDYETSSHYNFEV